MDEILEVIIVEGRYDKNTLSQVVRATILETRGYGIFTDKQKLQLIRRLAIERGVVILTDSDSAGFLIRNHLKGSVPEGRILHAYIPDRQGKERRKSEGGREGKLGVEGMDRETLLEALRRAGATFRGGAEEAGAKGPKLTKTHLYQAGLSGRPDSKLRRAALLKALDLPAHLTANGLLDVLNVLFSYEEGLRVLGDVTEIE
jgi:ribonuclease M5